MVSAATFRSPIFVVSSLTRICRSGGRPGPVAAGVGSDGLSWAHAIPPVTSTATITRAISDPLWPTTMPSHSSKSPSGPAPLAGHVVWLSAVTVGLPFLILTAAHPSRRSARPVPREAGLLPVKSNRVLDGAIVPAKARQTAVDASSLMSLRTRVAPTLAKHLEGLQQAQSLGSGLGLPIWQAATGSFGALNYRRAASPKKNESARGSRGAVTGQRNLSRHGKLAHVGDDGVLILDRPA